MKVNQIYGLLNTITTEITGNSALVAEDLSNLVDVGTAILDATSVDNYVKSLVDKVGKVVFVDRQLNSRYPSILMDAWEFGAIRQKIDCDIPNATENESWELTDKQSYDPNIFYKPTITNKFYSKKVTFEVPMSFTEMQVRSAFNSAEEYNGFISMILSAIEKSITIKTDALIQRTINNMIWECSKGGNSNVYVNLLSQYNTTTGKALKVSACMTDPDFIKFASMQMGMVCDRMTSISELYNLGSKTRFTPRELQRCVMLSEFKRAADVYLQADVRHNELTALPPADVVPFWQGSGKSYSFADTSCIKILNSGKETSITGVLACVFDHEALGVSNMNQRTTTNVNPRAEFTTSWYKVDSSYFNDLNENFVVFYIADVASGDET